MIFFTVVGARSSGLNGMLESMMTEGTNGDSSGTDDQFFGNILSGNF